MGVVPGEPLGAGDDATVGDLGATVGATLLKIGRLDGTTLGGALGDALVTDKSISFRDIF